MSRECTIPRRMSAARRCRAALIWSAVVLMGPAGAARAVTTPAPLEFPGAGGQGYVNTTLHASELNVPVSFSIWGYWLDDGTDRNKIFGWGNGTSGAEFEILGGTRTVRLRLGEGWCCGQIETPAPPANRWVHYGVVWTEKETRLYIDGHLAGTAGPASGLATDIWIGARLTAHQDSFGGLLKDWAIFDSDIGDAAMAGLADGIFPSGEPLVQRLLMNEGEGDVAFDSAGNLHGQIVGAAWSTRPEALLVERAPRSFQTAEGASITLSVALMEDFGESGQVRWYGPDGTLIGEGPVLPVEDIEGGQAGTYEVRVDHPDLAQTLVLGGELTVAPRPLLPFAYEFGSVRFVDLPRWTTGEVELGTADVGETVYLKEGYAIQSIPEELAGNLTIKRPRESSTVGALQFDGADDHIQVTINGLTSSGVVPGNKSFTIEFWSMLEPAPGSGWDLAFEWRGIVGGGTGDRIYVGHNSTTGGGADRGWNFVTTTNGARRDSNSDRALWGVFNRWKFVQAVQDREKNTIAVRVYDPLHEVWEEASVSTPPGSSNPAGHLYMPSHPFHFPYRGSLSDMRFWHKTRNKSDAERDMWRLSGNEEGLVAYWPMNEGQGNIVNDLTGRGNHGTIFGQPQWRERPLDLDNLSFVVSRDATVYVAYPMGLPVPEWLDARYTFTGMTIDTTAGGFNVYSREVAAREHVVVPQAIRGQGDNNVWVILDEGPEAIAPSRDEHFARAPAESWKLGEHSWLTSTRDPGPLKYATMLTRARNINPDTGFTIQADFRVPQLGHQGNNAYGLALLGDETGFLHAEWMPWTAGGNSAIRIRDTRNDAVLAEEPWQGMTPKRTIPSFDAADVLGDAQVVWFGSDGAEDDPRYFADENFRIAEMPERLHDQNVVEWRWQRGIRTSNSQRTNNSLNYLSFKLELRPELIDSGAPAPSRATVFVAWDVRALGREPDWLRENFELTDHIVRVNSPARAHRLWAAEFDVGDTVTLGGAAAPGSTLLPDALAHNYFVLLGDARGDLDRTHTIQAEGVRAQDGKWSLQMTLTDAGGHSQTIAADGLDLLSTGNQFGIAVRQHEDAGPAYATYFQRPIWETFNLSMDFLEEAPGLPETPTFEEWLAHFGLSGPDAAPTASPAGDGVANLIKYILGLHPWIPVGKGDLPQAAIDDQGRLTLTYIVQPGVDASHVLEVSYDLIDWTTDGVVEISRETVGEREEVTVRLEVEGDPERAFIRLRAE